MLSTYIYICTSIYNVYIHLYVQYIYMLCTEPVYSMFSLQRVYSVHPQPFTIVFLDCE